MTAILETRGLTKVYRSDGVETTAVRSVDLAVGRGDFLAIMGPSGCGKSTLLYLMGLLATPTEGTVVLAGSDTRDLGDGERTRLRRRHVGFVFQRFNLLGTLSAEDNVALALRLRRQPVGARARDMLAAVGLQDKRRRRPGQLSVGEQQRVAIARALVTRPTVLLADEPTGNLDSEASERVLDLVRRLHQEWDQTVLVITHNEQVAQRAGRLVRMRDGRIVAT
jgi:putative ABC transport system ATP-binding protein